MRNLERQIGTIARKVAAKRRDRGAHIDAVDDRRTIADDYLGPARFRPTRPRSGVSRPGVATGLAWTESGRRRAASSKPLLLPGGSGQLTLTGQLGDVMQESARAALSHVRPARARARHRPPEFLASTDLHVHVPAGAIPKDGPSAGVTMATAIVSALHAACRCAPTSR